MTGDAPEPRLVLFAEDDPLASMALRAQLEALQYRVIGPARNGDEAVALGACFPVDVALLDVRMPGRSGLEAGRDLFTLAPTPVVLLTGVSTADLPPPLPRPPVFELLSKPIGLDELRTGLQNARDRFLAWRRDSAASAPARDEDPRHTIARAIELTASDQRPAAAAAHLLQRARDQNRPPIDLARDLIQATQS